MTLAWLWPWAAVALLVAAVALVVVIVAVSVRRHRHDEGLRVFSLDDDLETEHASKLFHQWRLLNRGAVALLTVALLLAVALSARPAQVDADSERASSRDIVLCLDVSGSALPYDRQVIGTYRDLVRSFEGERIGLSIFNSTSRTVFPLTDDYELVTAQLDEAERLLRGVQSQDDIEAMSDEDYQRISDWLDGTQNRTNATSLIGDGLVSCAAMLPGFAYGSAPQTDGERNRAASIVLATDNVVSGDPTYTLGEALDLTAAVGIGVDGLYSGPRESEDGAESSDMRTLVESHGGVFLTQSSGDSVNDLVRRIDGATSRMSIRARRWWMRPVGGRWRWPSPRAHGWWCLGGCGDECTDVLPRAGFAGRRRDRRGYGGVGRAGGGAVCPAPRFE